MIFRLRDHSCITDATSFQALPKPSSLRILTSSSTRSYLGPANITAHLKNDLYPTKLGKKLIILDVDSRPWNINDPKEMTQLDWGRLNHYLYAQNHGYDYRYIQTPNPPQDTHATWVKVEAIAKVLREGYKFVVFTDSDVMFPWLNLPLEYLLSEWNVTSDIAITAGYAPDEPNKYDHTHKRRNINSGFMVVQDTSITAQLFKDWIECPTNVKYTECSHWKDEYWHEQSAYSDFVRHDYIDHVRELPCNDVNGGPHHPLEGDKKCSGKYVRHYWYDKNKVKDAVLDSIADTVVPSAVEGLSEYFYQSARVAS